MPFSSITSHHLTHQPILTGLTRWRWVILCVCQLYHCSTVNNSCSTQLWRTPLLSLAARSQFVNVHLNKTSVFCTPSVTEINSKTVHSQKVMFYNWKWTKIPASLPKKKGTGHSEYVTASRRPACGAKAVKYVAVARTYKCRHILENLFVSKCLGRVWGSCCCHLKSKGLPKTGWLLNQQLNLIRHVDTCPC